MVVGFRFEGMLLGKLALPWGADNVMYGSLSRGKLYARGCKNVLYKAFSCRADIEIVKKVAEDQNIRNGDGNGG